MRKAGSRLGGIVGGLLGAHRGEADGRVPGLPVSADVEILKDENGIPHIFAENEDDLFAAQGFMHAQDRLWQLETIRRLPRGRVSEVAGESMVDVDHFFLLAGFEEMRRGAISCLTEAERRILEAYASGINAFIKWTGKNLPLEFRSLKIVPAEWSVEDLCGVLPFTSWSLQMNYEQELLALLAHDRLDADLFNQLYPVEPGARLPRESFFEKFRNVRIAPLHPAALAFFPELARQSESEEVRAPVALPGHAGSAMSNCWAVAEGDDGAPILANDPHLAMMVPQIWHICHLHCPTLNVAGVSMLGFPGIILGRNERVSWGMTNVATDLVDLYVVKVDPEDPTRYFVGDEVHEMSREVTLIPIAGGATREVVVYRTVHGTVLSRMVKGSEAVAVLKWYGTLPQGTFVDTTGSCFLSLMRSRSVDEALEIGGRMKTAGQNLTVADLDGNVGWKATGLVPVRSGYTGRVPADGSDPGVGWTGFVPYEEMPSLKNPPAGLIATANNKTVSQDYPHHITYSWLATYRHDRIVSLVEGARSHTVETHSAIQMDIHSEQAERILPGLLALELSDINARGAQEILRSWDREMAPDSAGAAVFAVFLTEFETRIAESILGKYHVLFDFGSGFFYSPVDALLRGETADELLSAAGFKEGGIAALSEEALRRAMEFLSEALGPNRGSWRWGAIHSHLFAHAGASGRLREWMLNRGPFPAPGDMTTVNVSGYNPGRSGDSTTRYRAVTGPSMRFVTSMKDSDSTTIIAPMGQSGKPGNRHYDDMIERWLHGVRVPLPLTRGGAERIAKERVILGR